MIAGIVIVALIVIAILFLVFKSKAETEVTTLETDAKDIVNDVENEVKKL